jgi:hypothetical protein
MSPRRSACLIAITAFEPMSIWVIPFHWMDDGPWSGRIGGRTPLSHREARA